MFSWLYPDVCQQCGEASEKYLCARCREALQIVPRPICLYCGAPAAGNLADPRRCPNCSTKLRSFSFARSALLKTEASTRLIHDFKYRHARYLAPVLAEIMLDTWRQTPELNSYQDWWLVPVPITLRRLFKRGYNQAEELAHCLSRLTGARMLAALQRVNTGVSSQTRLSAHDRQVNAFAAYRLKRNLRRKGFNSPSHLLLVDDVYTTGSTLRACARALKTLPGVQTVGALTLLRVP